MKKLARNLLSVALIAALVLSLGVMAFAADEKEPFDFKIDLADKIEIEDVILQYVQDGENKELSVKKVLGDELYKKLGGRKIAEDIAYDRYCNDFSYVHIDEETVVGEKGTVTFPAAPEGGINCPDIIQVPRDLLKEGDNYVAYAIVIGFENGDLLTTGCAVLKDGVLGDLVNLGNVAVKDNLAKIIISPAAIQALGAKNGDIIRIILGGGKDADGNPIERSNDHGFLVPKAVAVKRGGGSNTKPTPTPNPGAGEMFGRHGVSFRSGGHEIGLEAVPVNWFGLHFDRVVVPYMKSVEDDGKTEISVQAGPFQWEFNAFDAVGSFLGYLLG